ncbi:RNA polymerase sigma-70 factor [Dyadobacter bucti]|uniref:RNA polymerase sigma-70 factor n=1 Tax=Dyadobacter bucti TaxID=2572203 RepID=UPI001107A709|nr:RNA polymerase sigma-70 factor [Dyadobacter bucti]
MGLLKKVYGNADKDPDEELLDLEGFFREYYDRLVYFSLQIVKDRDLARDIAQDAFIKYWQQRDSMIPNNTAVKNFLYSTVRNASFNSLRHYKVVQEYAGKLGGEEPEEASVMEAMITAEVLAEIHSAIESLPEHYRVISVMGYMEGKKNQEIADCLGMSVNTVKKQKQRALELLRLKLTPELFAIATLMLGS